MMIPREIIEEIQQRSDIEEVIGSYVNLKRAGSNFNGLCPFHSEKSPSFTVFPSTGSFYCFGCGVGGDVFTFIMKAENLDYVSAIELLAKRAGVTIPSDSVSVTGKPEMSRRRVYDMNLDAAKFFRQCLYDEKLGKAGMDYLVGSRRLSQSTIKHFGLGFSPNSFGMLTDHMHSLGYTDEELTKGFLCGKSRNTGRAIDYFRNRVMFPIIDTSGNIVAFGGRVMDDSKPKYLNSSDTPGFKKSRNLFALNYAKNHCAEQMILCEGYMDVIALHAAGFENAVATLGTAITSEQARIMSKYTKRVIISYDNDEAGQRAANRAMAILGEVGMDVRILQMSGAKDPDEYIRKFGADRFRHIIGESKTGFEFRLQNILSKYDTVLPEEKIKATAQICELIASYSSSVEREVYISSVSEKLGISKEGIEKDVERILRKRRDEYRSKESREAHMSVKGIGDRVNPDAVKNPRANAIEEAILGLMLMYNEYRDAVVFGKVELCADDFFTELGKRIFTEMLELQKSEGGFLPSLMGEKFTPEEMGRMQKMEYNRRQLTENGWDNFRSAVDALKAEKKRTDSRNGGDWIENLQKRRDEIKKKQSRDMSGDSDV